MPQVWTFQRVAVAITLGAADLANLNLIASLAGLGNLGIAPMTGFATALGGSSVMSTDFYMDPAGLQTATGSGDLFATSNEANYYPLVDAVPEPTNLLVWGGLFGLVAARRRLADRSHLPSLLALKTT